MHLTYSKNSQYFYLTFAILIGVCARFLVALHGNNFDFDSWVIVAQIFTNGDNVYAETQRYNYGPIWFHILGYLYLIPTIWPFELFNSQFRFEIVSLLTISDLLIYRFLFKKYGLRAANLFLLNPITIIITGYHNQMDGVAILFALYATEIYGNQSSARNRFIGLIGIGISLSMKHILFLFPVWLAFKEGGWSKKVSVILIPYLVFLLGFIPYFQEGMNGILKNVFFYTSLQNPPLWSLVIPASIFSHIPLILPFILSMIAIGIFFKKKSTLLTLYLYLICVVIFSAAATNQYLVIPTVSTAVLWNWGYALYTIAGTLFLMAEPGGGLGLTFLNQLIDWINIYQYTPLILLLGIGLLISLKRKKMD